MKSFRISNGPGWVILLGILLFARGLAAQTPAQSQHPVNVILWFDTEDYLLLADDDADKRLADLLSQRHIRATFKVVGEKARVLESRGRHDVIEALSHHCIGYHSNFHSVHPVPAEYMADCGLLDGIEEFVRHEARGAADVRRIFSVPSLACYGQPGSSWTPQAVAALWQCGVGTDGVPCYVDSGSHVGLGGKPFWYCGVLNVYNMSPNETRMDLWADGGLAKGEHEFKAIADRLSAQGGGLISIYYHPCEWVHEKFWDSVNFSRGANPPREQWKAPPQRPAAETDAAIDRYAAYIDFMRSLPEIHFVTACDLPKLYPDPLRTEGASRADLLAIANHIVDPGYRGADAQVIAGHSYSPADQFALLAEALASHIHHPSEAATESSLKEPDHLLGPDSAPPTGTKPRTIDWFAFRDATLDADDYVQQHHRIPARVFIGPDAVAPADFLSAMAKAFVEWDRSAQPPKEISIPSGIELLSARHVIKNSPKVYGGWIIHRENFEAPKVLDVARLQAWTLKPAMPAN